VSADEGITVDLKTNRYDYVINEDAGGGKQRKVRLHAFGLVDPAIQDRIEQAQKASGQPVTIRYTRSEDSGFWTSVLVSWLPMLLIFGLFFVFLRQMQAGGGRAMSFGKSKARLLTERKNKITFADVAGSTRRGTSWRRSSRSSATRRSSRGSAGGSRRACCSWGRGHGQDAAARAIAGEAGVPFFTISGSDSSRCSSVWVRRACATCSSREEERAVHHLHRRDRCVGRHRGAGLGGGHDEREQTLNQLLVEMDGFEGKENVIIIAATNRPTFSTPRCCARGRFDRAHRRSAARRARAYPASCTCTPASRARCRSPTT